MNRSELLIACMGRDDFPPADAVYEVISGTNVLSHVEAYTKQVFAGVPLWVWGIAQVCTDPDWRGLGLARALVRASHEDARAHGYKWAMLFSDYTDFYAPLGYERIQDVLVAPLADDPFPRNCTISYGAEW